jgi:multidrug efflux pump subunit AcrA (membrane-fusion protein)
MPARARRKRFVTFAPCGLGFALLATAIHAQRPEPAHASRADESHQVGQAVRVGLTSLAASVAFDARKLATMSTPVQGRVLRIDVAVGDRVTEGTLLLTLSSPDVAAANAQLWKTKPARAAAERRAAPGSNEYQLRSPIAGVVVEQNVAVGTVVDIDREQPLITVADLSTLWVMTNVEEHDLALVHLGDQARVRVPVLPGRDAAGTLTYIGDMIDPTTDTAVARIEVPNFDARLRPGMVATVDIVESETFKPRDTP